ncbi:MAG: GrpB family protein [Pseudomonadota bacterium]
MLNSYATRAVELGLSELHHIGSTAVPKLAAQPTIDILAVIGDEKAIAFVLEKLQAQGYQVCKSHDTKDSLCLWKRTKEHQTHHLYVLSAGHPNIQAHLEIRDYLRSFPQKVREYSVLKSELANDPKAYGNGKHEYLSTLAETALKHSAWVDKFGPHPDTPYPSPLYGNQVCFLKNIVTRPNIIVGDYTYYHDFNGVDDFETTNVLYHWEQSKDRLIIGKFCQIACGATFIMNEGQHQVHGFSTYPFTEWQGPWAHAYTPKEPFKGDTIIGNDAWISYKARFMPGVKVGDGAIIGAYSVVTKDVPPYTLVAGNPARIIRPRFDEDTIQELLKLQWWNWPLETIMDNMKHIVSNDLEVLQKVAERLPRQ